MLYREIDLSFFVVKTWPRAYQECMSAAKRHSYAPVTTNAQKPLLHFKEYSCISIIYPFNYCDVIHVHTVCIIILWERTTDIKLTSL
jgi:hypothetical protein